ncbi:MAG: hypothetical protein AAB320_09310 [Elusimicrobiota bacterium]
MAPGRGRFAVYSSSAGNYFWAEIRHLLACGLRKWGASAVEADERGWADADWHIVVGAQEFFSLGRGRRLQRKPWPPGVVLYNSEQPGHACSAAIDKLRPRAHAVWEMSRLPLGWVEGCALFRPVRRLPDLPLTRGLPPGARGLDGRPLDLLFLGSSVPRREEFFAAQRGLFAGHRSVVRLVDDALYVRHGKAAPRHTKAWLGLAQRAKIVLNVHRQETGYFAWHRIALHGIAQGALVLSEPVLTRGPLKAGRDFVEAKLEDFPEAIGHYLSSERGRKQAAAIAAQGLATYRRTCRLERFLPAAVKALGSPERAAALPSRLRAEAAAELLAGKNTRLRRTAAEPR